jgi:ankyrin repeat protein
VLLVRTLLKGGANVKQTNDHGETALHTACIYGKEGVVEALLEAGSDPNARATGETSLDMTVLAWCVYGGHISSVRALLEAGADVNAQVRKSEGERDEWVTVLDVVNKITAQAEWAVEMRALLLQYGAQSAEAGGSVRIEL